MLVFQCLCFSSKTMLAIGSLALAGKGCLEEISQPLREGSAEGEKN